MSMFHVGQRVVAISNPSEKAMAYWVGQGMRYPVIGCIYTIRELGHSLGRPAVRLEEIINPPIHAKGYEPGFNAHRFRPVKDTSIEIFRSLLSPIPEEVA
jgi:hypothetical protein